MSESSLSAPRKRKSVTTGNKPPNSAFEKSQELLKTRRSDVNNLVTSFGGVFPDGRNKLHLNAPCIGPLIYGNTKEWEGLSTFFIYNQADASNKAHELFVSWLLSPTHSPFREMIRAQAPQDRDFIDKYGYVLTDLNFATNLVANFLTAFRTPREKPGLVAMWYALLQEGIKPGTAAWICGGLNGSCSYSDETKLTQKYVFMGELGHYWLSPWSNGSDAIRRLNEGDPCKSKFLPTLFNRKTYYTPCNVIWSESNGASFTTVMNNFVKTLKKSNSSPVKRMFTDPSPRDQVGNVDFWQVVEVCKALERNEITW